MKINVSTSKNVDMKLNITKQNSNYSSAVVLSATGACCYKITSYGTLQKSVLTALYSQ